MNNDRLPAVLKPVWAGLLAVASCIGLLSPSGMAYATDNISQSAGAGQVTSARAHNFIDGDITLSRVTLSEGRAWYLDRGAISEMNRTIDQTHQRAFEVRSEENSFEAKIAYRVSMLGKPTNYWVGMHMHVTRPNGRVCVFYDGSPAEGGQQVSASPFNCRSNWEYTDDGRRLHYDFEIDLNRAAEASGTITTSQVALTEGTFRSDLPYNVAGKTELAPGQTTDFEAVMREGDTSFFENEAHTEFSYQIEAEGKPTGFWAAGVSTNHRGWAVFHGDGHCGIYDRDPLRGNKPLDWTDPVESAEFFCDTKGSYKGKPGTGYGHFHADFTVGRF